MLMPKPFLVIALAALAGATLAAQALAAPAPRPEPYQGLSAVDGGSAGQTPALAGGYGALSTREHGYRESLPLQLSGPMKKLKGAKYKHSGAKRGSLQRASHRKAAPHPVKKAKARGLKA